MAHAPRLAGEGGQQVRCYAGGPCMAVVLLHAAQHTTEDVTTLVPADASDNKLWHACGPLREGPQHHPCVRHHVVQPQFWGLLRGVCGRSLIQIGFLFSALEAYTLPFPTDASVAGIIPCETRSTEHIVSC